MTPTMERLPKAKLIQVRLTKSWRTKPLYARCANCAVVYWLGLEIVWRRPWLAESAERLHPGAKP